MVKRSSSETQDEVLVLEISCREAWREISEMIDGSLEPGMRRRMALHLKHCAHCKAIYDGARNMVQLVSEEAVFELPPGFSDRLWERLWQDFCHEPG